MLVILLSLSKINSFLIAWYEFIEWRFMLYRLFGEWLRKVIDQVDRATRPLLEPLDYDVSTLPHVPRGQLTHVDPCSLRHRLAVSLTFDFVYYKTNISQISDMLPWSLGLQVVVVVTLRSCVCTVVNGLFIGDTSSMFTLLEWSEDVFEW